MKKCPWCAAQYPDDATVCTVDQNPLETFSPAPSVAPPIVVSDVRYKGVRGWLLLFCIGLTVFNPLVMFAVIVGTYVNYGPYFGKYPGLVTTSLVRSSLAIIMAGCGVYTGIALWRVRPGAVQVAKAFLWFVLVYVIVVALLPLTAGLPAASTKVLVHSAVLQIGRAIIYFAVWYAYFTVSKRVKATYA